MKEELLHYVWKTKNFDFRNLTTTHGQEVQIKKFGHHNHNSGPDFLQGQVIIDGQNWNGHIEMHLKSSDWFNHKHDEDPAYQNVVLHVVWEEDQLVCLSDGSVIPCIEMKSLIPSSIMESYDRITNNTDWVPCAKYLGQGVSQSFYMQRHRLFIERLEAKSIPLYAELERTRNDWNQLLFYLIARSLGLSVNADAMAHLTQVTPLRLINKHSDQLLQVESILYGQSGMLEREFEDKYPLQLKSEYAFLQQKYRLKSMDAMEWKLLRMRPSSFPTLRISQLAQLYTQHSNLHEIIVNSLSTKELYNVFSVATNEYWESHYVFDKLAKNPGKRMLGKSAIELIIINAIVPYLFVYGQYKDDPRYVERAIEIIQQVPPENNKVVRGWKNLGVRVENAFDSQALLFLQKNYCQKTRCLECQFGNELLKSISQLIKEESTELIETS